METIDKQTVPEEMVPAAQEQAPVVEALLGRLEKFTVADPTASPFVELKEMYSLISQARSLGLEREILDKYRYKMDDLAGNYYGHHINQINRQLDHLEAGMDLGPEVENIFSYINFVREINNDPFPAFKELKNILLKAEESKISVTGYFTRLQEMAARYYDEKIPTALGRLEEKIQQRKPESYMLMGGADVLINEAKMFGVSTVEASERLESLKKLLDQNPIRI